jgi:hypothetical protein
MVKGEDESDKYGSVVGGGLKLKGGIKKKGKKAKRKEAKKREQERLRKFEEAEREEEELEINKGKDDDLTPAQKRFQAKQETRVCGIAQVCGVNTKPLLCVAESNR